ncbi:hypothetical protein Q0F99_19495 [Rathayibacter oskolensis]|uniref:hypothetical protein n=1 Tax=Rathayibacter oskolensis TaxID=1891671 RepID=UPI00265ED826|nr:hypothetical protein [Rathayibacter oskolensis]WKK71511.1 hypothetical protein Q0F99_19495 [Rathayibacter oskolensis]
MTLAVDRAFGSDWADNEEILALVTIATSDGVSSRAVAEASGWGRRAVSRLVARLGRTASSRRVPRRRTDGSS